MRELIETEEEFGRDLLLVVEHYIKVLDKKTTPKLVSDNKDLIFGNFKQIAEFHNTYVLLNTKSVFFVAFIELYSNVCFVPTAFS